MFCGFETKNLHVVRESRHLSVFFLVIDDS